MYTGKGLAQKQPEPIGRRVNCPYPVNLLSIGSGYFLTKPFPVYIHPTFLEPSNTSYLPAYEDETVFRNVGI